MNIIVENVARVISPLSLSHTHTAGGDLWAQASITEYNIVYSLFIEM